MMAGRLVLSATLVALAAVAAANGLDAPVDAYRRAASLGEVGTIRGKAFEERRRPSAPDLPLTGVAVLLLPRSESWLGRLETIKRGSRDSANVYREAATALRRAREAYEKSLLEVGAGDLSHEATADAEGSFTLDGVPAGPWVLFASRSSYVNRTPQSAQGPRPGAAPPPPRPVLPSPFLPQEKVLGYDVVTYWVRSLTVAPGASEPVELTDRNVWFTGVIENRQAPKLPDQPFMPPR